jgi:hypothetical protein
VNLRIVARLGVLALIGVLVYWIATHTYWADQTLPRSARGEALRDPFYAAERLARALGAHASYDRLWRLPAESAIIVTAYWDWDRSSTHRAQLQQWVESGGRLVVEFNSLSHRDAFSRWSGITGRNIQEAETGHHIGWNPGGCRDEEESGVSLWPATATSRHYQLCGLYLDSFLASSRTPVWKVADGYGAQALRISVGRGSVTAVNGDVLTYGQLLKGTHASLLVAATQLHSGDDVHFLSDADHASLLALTWRFGASVVVLLLLALALALWRAAPRFGPTMAPPESARRSLAEQIRGTGQFLLRVGDGQALHAATVRALLAAATRRIGAFSSLSSVERINRLARATGFSAEALAAAVNYRGVRRGHELHSAIALLEGARREILRNDNRSTHGY